MKVPSYLTFTFIVIVGVTCLLIGYYIGEYQFRKEISIKTAELEELEMQNLELRFKIENLEERIRNLDSEKTILATEVKKLDEELSRLITKLESKDREIVGIESKCRSCGEEIAVLKNKLVEVRRIINKLRQDQELLSLLMTDPPLNRTEAKLFWNDTRVGLYRLNPNLVPTVDSILYYLDYYFDWYESIPADASPEQICTWIFSYTEEAREYESAISKLRSEILVTIVSDLGEALRLLEELE